MTPEIDKTKFKKFSTITDGARKTTIIDNNINNIKSECLKIKKA